ncbi:hypothetical protein P7C70_g5309, partial [Phenoliferia sp. Uapishka_3]
MRSDADALLKPSFYKATLFRALHPAQRSTLAAPFDSPPRKSYWRDMATIMFTHAFDVIELQATVNQIRTGPGAGGTPFMGFCLYLAGSVLIYGKLCPWRTSPPAQMCPSKVAMIDFAITSALSSLQALTPLWPIATRWHQSLLAQFYATPRSDEVEDEAATHQAHEDIALDKEQGIYRQYAPVSSPTGSPGGVALAGGTESTGLRMAGTEVAQDVSVSGFGVFPDFGLWNEYDPSDQFGLDLGNFVGIDFGRGAQSGPF